MYFCTSKASKVGTEYRVIFELRPVAFRPIKLQRQVPLAASRGNRLRDRLRIRPWLHIPAADRAILRDIKGIERLLSIGVRV